jgi:hypothetical protein
MINAHLYRRYDRDSGLGNSGCSCQLIQPMIHTGSNRLPSQTTQQCPMVSIAHHTRVRMKQPRCELLLLLIREHSHAPEALLIGGLPAPSEGTHLPGPGHGGKTEKDHSTHVVDGVEHAQHSADGLLLGQGGAGPHLSRRAPTAYHLNASG